MTLDMGRRTPGLAQNKPKSGPAVLPNLHYEHGGPYSLMKCCFSFGALANKRFQNLDPQNQ